MDNWLSQQNLAILIDMEIGTRIGVRMKKIVYVIDFGGGY